jgi:glutathione S-transferase
MTELDARSLYVARRHGGLASICGEAPTAVDSARMYFLHNLEAMTPRIPKVGYLFGAQLSTADILLMTCLDWASAADIALPQQMLEGAEPQLSGQYDGVVASCAAPGTRHDRGRRRCERRQREHLGASRQI